MNLDEEEDFCFAVKNSLAAFTDATFKTVNPSTKYYDNWHIDLICDHLEACNRREIKRLIINQPPRSMKSTTVSIAFPAWAMGHNPALQFMYASYSQGLSMKHNMDTRLVVQSEWYKTVFPDFELRDDQNTKSQFITTKNGFRYATGVGSTITGFGGDVLCVDDPCNPMQAASEIQRERANEWFRQTYSTRLNDKKEGVIIVIMQRLHEQDLTGMLLEQGGWTHLNLPMIAERKTIINFGTVNRVREEGELLHSERIGVKEVEQMRTELGSYGFSAQGQQRPAPAGGGLMKSDWFQYFDELPDESLYEIQSWDTAQKEDQLNDYNVCIEMALDAKGNIYIDYIFRDKGEYPKLKSQAEKIYEVRPVDMLIIEDKGHGTALIQEMQKKKVPVIAINPRGDKVMRASAVSATVACGKVFLKRGASWIQKFFDEINIFPKGAHDDQVDAFSQGVSFLSKKRIQSKKAPVYSSGNAR